MYPFLASCSLVRLTQKLPVLNKHHVRVCAEVIVITRIEKENRSYLTGFKPETNAISLWRSGSNTASVSWLTRERAQRALQVLTRFSGKNLSISGPTHPTRPHDASDELMSLFLCAFGCRCPCSSSGSLRTLMINLAFYGRSVAVHAFSLWNGHFSHLSFWERTTDPIS